MKTIVKCILITLLLVTSSTAALVGLYLYAFRDRVYYGVYLQGAPERNLAGKTKEELIAMIEQFELQLTHEQIIIESDNKNIKINPVQISTDPTLSRELVSFPKDEGVAAIFSLGRTGTWQERLQAHIRLLTQGVYLQIPITLDEPALTQTIELNFPELLRPATPPSVKLTPGGTLVIVPATSGKTLATVDALRTLRINLTMLRNPVIRVTVRDIAPPVSTEEAETLLPILQQRLAQGPFTLATPDEKHHNNLSPATLTPWIAFTKRGTIVIPILNSELVAAYLQTLTTTINREPIEARFTEKEGKIIEFQTSTPGQELDIPATVAALEKSLFTENVTTLPLVMVEKKAKVGLENIESIGIKEKLAEGSTSFAGSPVNRRHNIAVATKKINGILIKPGEVFSLNAALGEIGAASGYREELVIKGNRTTPEFGGGLCQVATTLFRLALNTGLPIVERQNHSFRVRYYEPAGMDATIYSPAPDFKFLNNTPGHLLLIAKVVGDKLVYEFWGTSDARTVKFSATKVWDITPPGPTQYIDTQDIPEGTQKCVEHAVAGARAEFTRTVTDASGQSTSATFRSKYRPWPEVCLVGKKSPSPPLVAPTNPSP